jgi:hypothetical protein
MVAILFFPQLQQLEEVAGHHHLRVPLQTLADQEGAEQTDS